MKKKLKKKNIIVKNNFTSKSNQKQVFLQTRVNIM